MFNYSRFTARGQAYLLSAGMTFTIWTGVATAASPPSEAVQAPAGSEVIVVTATRTPNQPTRVPVASGRIDLDDLSLSQPDTLADLLDMMPGVDFGGGARPAAQIPTIRGHSGKRIVLLVDGARRNEASQILSPLFLSPELLTSAEVVRGPASSLYGSGAIGGVMSFRTLSAADFMRPGQTLGGQVSAAFESADLSHRATTHLYGQEQAVDALLTLSHRDWRRMKLADDEKLVPNDGDSLAGLFKLGWQISPDLRSELSYQRYNENNFRSTNPQAGNDFPFRQQHRITQEDLVLNLTADGDNPWHTTLYHSRLLRKAERNLESATPLNATRNETETLGFSLIRSHTLTTDLSRHRISLGADGYHDRQFARDDGRPNSVIPDGTQTAWGLFAQDEIGIASDWLVIPSLRWDRFTTSPESGRQADTHADRLSGKLAAQWQATPGLNLFASYGTAFRAPTLTELYTELNDPLAFSNFAPNPDLAPEVAHTFELGGHLDRSGLLSPRDRGSLRLNLYRENVRDLIEATVISTYIHPFLGVRPVQQYRNIRDARRWGLELDGRYALNNWELWLNYTRMRVEDRATGEHLFSPPDQAHLQLDYRWPQLNTSLRWRSTWVAAQDYDSTPLRRRERHDRHDLFMSWTPDQDWRLDLGVTNLFDEAYSSYQSANRFADINEKGRSWKASLTARF